MMAIMDMVANWVRPSPSDSSCRNTHLDILTTSLRGGFFMIKFKLTVIK